jgi:hypothetical protein
MPDQNATRLNQRLGDPKDSLSRFFDSELSTALRKELRGQLASRVNAGVRSTGPANKIPDVISPDQRSTTADQNSTSPKPTQRPTDKPFPPWTVPTPTDPWYFPKPQMRTAPAPPSQGPSIFTRLWDLVTNLREGVSPVMMGIVGILPITVVEMAVGAARASIISGGISKVGEAAEAAAREILEYELTNRGHSPNNVFDLNNLRNGYPGLDFLTPEGPVQVKLRDLKNLLDSVEKGRVYVRMMKELYGIEQHVKTPITTAKRLVADYAEIRKSGAWPRNWKKVTEDAIRQGLTDTVFAIPDDHVEIVRRELAKEFENVPALREAIPSLRLGTGAKPDLREFSDLPASIQKTLKQMFVETAHSRVMGVGMSTDQFRAIVDEALDDTL